MPASQPRPEQIEALARNHPGGDLYMLNTEVPREGGLCGRARDGFDGTAGVHDLRRRGAEVIEGPGGGLLFGGAANVLVIGDGELEWDWIGVMRYPSFDHFTKMTASEAYQAIHVHRDAGLEHGVDRCLDLPQSLADWAEAGS